MQLNATLFKNALFSLLLIAFCFTPQWVYAQTESEPNNGYATANPIAFATNMSGAVACTAGDNDDYFRVILPAGNKSIRLITTASMTSGSGAMFVYLYNKYQQQLDNKYIGVNTTLITDTLDYTCFEGDTFYVRIQHWNGGCKNYTVRCENTNRFTLLNDTEVNDGFSTAQNLVFQKDTTGHIASQRYIGAGPSDDNDDYFRCILPAGSKKSLRLRYAFRQVTPGSNGGVYVYFYNKYQQELINKYVATTTTLTSDSLDYTCFEGDTFYVRIRQWTGTCKEYRIHMSYTNEYTMNNDAEPNDDFATAIHLPFQKDTTGHLAAQRYIGGPTTDIDDYFRVVMPAGGTKSIRLISQNRMVQPGQNGSVYYYLYNKYQQELTNKYVGFDDTLTIDTLDYTCFEGDTFYVRVRHWNGSCKEYRIKTDYTNQFTWQNDAEPNDDFASAISLPFQKDTSGHLAAQRYLAAASGDAEDYYRVILPPGGTKSIRLISQNRAVQPGQNGSIYYYLYNKYQQELINKYVSFGNTTVVDTLDYTCFEGDTFYVRVRHWNGPCKEYRIRTDYTGDFTLQNDTEPNDDLATATNLTYNRDTTGHLAGQRYLGGASTDVDDYYRCVVPTGTQSLRLIYTSRAVQRGQSGGMYYYLYNKYGQELINKYSSFGSTAVTDTLNYPCFEGDTFYVRARNWTGPCKEYRIRATSTGYYAFANDTERNDTRATAQSIDFGQTVTGHLASQAYGTTAPYTDGDDYFRCILPNNGKGVKLVTAWRATEPGTTGAIYYYLYDSSGRELANRYVTFGSTLKLDTLEFNCIQPDTFYIRMRNWSGNCKEYSLRTVKSTTGPIAFDISHTRFGNDFSFMNTTRNAKTYRWNFGDGTTDTVAAPTHAFGIGKFVVTLNATNICGTRAFRDTIEVNGVEKYLPTRAGSENGLGVFALRIFGGGLDSTISVRLKKGGTEYAPIKVSSPRSQEATASYSFKTLPVGTYDLEISIKGQKYSYPNGFEVYTDTPGFNIVPEIIAPSRVRTGRMNSYALKIHNKKGRIANGVRVFIVLPRGMKNDIHKTLWKPKGTIELKGATYDKLTIDRDVYESLYYGGDFDPDRDVFTVNQDALYNAVDSSLQCYNIDSLFGRPFSGTVYPIYVPLIKANGTYTLSFQAGTPGNGNFTVAAFCQPWTTRQNPVSGQTLDYIHEGGMQAAALAEMAPNPALKAVGKSAAYVDVGSQIAFTEFFDWYYGVNNADQAFYAKQGMSLAANEAGNRLPFGKKADDYAEAANAANRRMQRQTQSMLLEDKIKQTVKDPRLREVMEDRIQDLQDAIRRNSDAITDAQKEQVMQQFYEWSAKQGINLTNKQIESLLFPKDLPEKKVESLASYDPNDIYGPDGPGRQNYIKRDVELPYEVVFENYDTALVPAQIVRVTVNLDTNKFDLRHTTLGAVRFGGRVYQFEEDRSDYFRDIDLRPAKNMIVRVNAKTDTLTGQLYWEFLSLDPVTKNLIDDVLDGFLPPNKNSPEGEGGVTFTTRLKPTVANRDSVSAFATIYFDENDPILTPSWVNTVDEGLPSSTLAPTIQVKDSIMTLSPTATDGESGFREYRLYVKIGDSAWLPEPYTMNDVTQNIVWGTPGETYSFYVEARDSVGNWEKKPQKAEATVTLTRTKPPVAPNSIAIYPNPAGNSVNIKVNADQDGALRINVTNINGQQVSEYNMQHSAGTAEYQLNTTSLQAGVYFVEVFVNEKSLRMDKLVIVR